MHPQDDSTFRFRTRERRVKTVNFDVGKNCPKLIGYHSNVPWTTAKHRSVFTARGYAKRGICRRRVSVCLCVCLSHSGIVSKRLNVGSRKQRRMIAPRGRQMQVGSVKFVTFDEKRAITRSITVQDRRIVSIKVE